jgi:hypothetical protein
MRAKEKTLAGCSIVNTTLYFVSKGRRARMSLHPEVHWAYANAAM